MNIGAAAASSGVTAKMIRHYEAIGLLRPAERRANDYRDYGERDLHELQIHRRARRLGFSIPKSASCWLYGAIAAARAGRSSASPRRISAIFSRASPRCRRWRTRFVNWSPPAMATTGPIVRSSTIWRWTGAPASAGESAAPLASAPREPAMVSGRRFRVSARYTAVSKSMYPPTEAGSAKGKICVAQKPPIPFLRSIQ